MRRAQRHDLSLEPARRDGAYPAIVARAARYAPILDHMDAPVGCPPIESKEPLAKPHCPSALIALFLP